MWNILVGVNMHVYCLYSDVSPGSAYTSSTAEDSERLWPSLWRSQTVHRCDDRGRSLAGQADLHDHSETWTTQTLFRSNTCGVVRRSVM